jgi:hypothetical protein
MLPATTGSGSGLLMMLRGIFIACKASKEIIIKRKEVILRNQHIIHRKLEIIESLEEFYETWSSNAPHENNNDKNDYDELDDGEEE